MTTAENPIHSVATAVRGAADKAIDLMDSTHLHSLGDIGHEAASRVRAGAPDLTARLGSAPADLHSLRETTARKAHQLAQSIDDHAEALAPTRAGGHRWLKRFLVLALLGGAAFYLGRKLTGQKTQPQQRVNEAPVGTVDEHRAADGSSTGATQGVAPDTMATTPGAKSRSNGARSTKAEAK
jgi:hypothetical protein